jgi:hypothetical protein
MGYNPKLKLYYVQGSGIASENNRLVPAPVISISPEYYYANDINIGYTYNITLNGYATSLDLRSYSGEQLGFQNTVESIQTIKNIFNNNGGTLLAVDDNNSLLFNASGINVKSLNFEQSDNNWVNYSRYSIELEANEIQLSDCTGVYPPVLCSGIAEGIVDSPYLIDMKKYKVKSFSDDWTFSLDDNIYNSYNFDEANFNNEHFNITYAINATGKHYFVNNKLIPAWEQAKNFCQYRLYAEVSKLIDQAIIRSPSDDGCVTTNTLQNVFGSGNNYLLDGLSDSDYKIFNEKVSCNTSEAEGSFSLTYTAILKRTSGDSTYTDPNTIHTFSTTRNVQDDGKTKVISVSVDGNIQGLIEGGLIKGSGILSLPNNGQILLISPLSSGIDKYGYALSTYNKIAANNTLNANFAQMLGITYSSLNVSGGCIDASGSPPQSSHSATHNYTEGTITYNTSYNSNRACGNNVSYTNASITFQDKIPSIQEFNIPGRSGGPIIQKIGVDQPKKITINIDGATLNNNCCPDIESLLTSACGSSPIFSGIPSALIDNMILTENRYNTSSDGSYSITRAYIYHDI